MDEDDGEGETTTMEEGVRKRSEGGERLTRKRRREEGEAVREEVVCEVCGTVRLVSDKEFTHSFSSATRWFMAILRLHI